MSEATDTTPAYSIQTRGLNLWYGDFQALDDVTLRIKPNMITALVGPSGGNTVCTPISYSMAWVARPT